MIISRQYRLCSALIRRREKQPVYLHCLLAASLASRSLRSNNDNSFSISRVKTNTDARAFHSCAPPLWNNLSLSVRSAISSWRHIALTWPFPHRYRHAQWPVDVTELFPRFCCWTLIRLSRYWAWLRRAYWRYRKLIYWLIDWSMSCTLLIYVNGRNFGRMLL